LPTWGNPSLLRFSLILPTNIVCSFHFIFNTINCNRILLFLLLFFFSWSLWLDRIEFVLNFCLHPFIKLKVQFFGLRNFQWSSIHGTFLHFLLVVWFCTIASSACLRIEFMKIRFKVMNVNCTCLCYCSLQLYIFMCAIRTQSLSSTLNWKRRSNIQTWPRRTH
jgi:hypothetical protein